MISLRWWPADLHVIGKDIVRFHAVYWPAFLMSAKLQLPKQVFGHGFLLNRGEKMSKSVGNVTDPIELVERFGVDPLRYFLLREVSFGQDGSYSEEAIVTRCNADLANNLGNLAQRCLSIVAKNCGGQVPPMGGLTAAEEGLMASIAAAEAGMRAAMRDLAIHVALEAIWSAARDANQYFADAAPWSVRKTDPERADTILHVTIEAIRRIAIMARWAIPDGADRLLDLLGQGMTRGISMRWPGRSWRGPYCRHRAACSLDWNWRRRSPDVRRQPLPSQLQGARRAAGRGVGQCTGTRSLSDAQHRDPRKRVG